MAKHMTNKKKKMQTAGRHDAIMLETDKIQNRIYEGAENKSLKSPLSLSSLRSCVCHCQGCEIGKSDADDEVGKM